MSEWFYTKDEQQQGPVNTDQLRQLATSGQLLASDLIWKEGMSEWAEASDVEPLGASWPAKANPRLAVPPPVPKSRSPVPPSAPAAAPEAVEGKLTSQRARQVFDSLTEKLKVLGKDAAAKAQMADASIPTRIKIGTFHVPKLAVYGVVGGIIVLALIWLLSGGSGNSNLTASELQNAYADIKGNQSGPYDEKFVRVSGKVYGSEYYDSSNVVAPDRTHLSLQTDTDKELACIFRGRSSGKTDLYRLSRGDEVTVKGKCKGRNMVGGVVIEECEIVSAPSER